LVRRNFAKPVGEPAVLEFLKARAQGALAILDKRLSRSPYLLGAEPTIADISMTSYLYYPSEEFGFDIAAARMKPFDGCLCIGCLEKRL
jgi:glutathione S-transferase